MRVSSNAPSLSRRSIMRGMAAALVGASVPVAAIAGITARNLTGGDDTELLSQCREWQDQRRRMKRIEKELRRLHDEAQANMPAKPPELFEPIDTARIFDLRWVVPDEPWSNVALPGDGSWPRERLEFYAKELRNDPRFADVHPSPECKAHCRKLLALLDKHEATEKRIWATHNRLERIWERGDDKNWSLFLRIIRTKAETLQGAAAQFEVLERYWYRDRRCSPKGDAAIRKLMANLRRLVAAYSVEA